MPVRYILSSVWVKLSIFSQLSIIQYIALCVFNLSICLVKTENLYFFLLSHYQIGSMNHYPLFRVMSWSNGMRCMSLYIVINSSTPSAVYMRMWIGSALVRMMACRLFGAKLLCNCVTAVHVYSELYFCLHHLLLSGDLCVGRLTKSIYPDNKSDLSHTYIFWQCQKFHSPCQSPYWRWPSASVLSLLA